MGFIDLKTDAGLAVFDEYIAAKRYIQGYLPTSLDLQAVELMGKAPNAKYTHAARFYAAITSLPNKNVRAGGPVPDQLAGSAAAPAVAAASPAPAAKAAAPAAAASGDVAKIQEAIAAQGNVIRELKSKGTPKDQLQPEIEKLLALKEQLKAAGGEVAAPPKQEKKKKNKGGNKGGDNNNNNNQGGGKKKNKKKVEKTPEEKMIERRSDEKVIKAVKKEGGKMGQDIIGVSEMGGLEFFCTKIDQPEGDLELAKICLEAMNKEVEPDSEERRGGAGPVGKMLFAPGVSQLAVIAKIPEDKKGKLDVGDWMKNVMDAIKGEVVEAKDDFATGIVKADSTKGIFPVKIYPDGIQAAVMYLRAKGLFPEDDDDSDDQCYGDDDFDEEW